MIRTNKARVPGGELPVEQSLESGPIGVRGRVREYPWGDHTFIPRLIGQEVTGQPQAELWLGAHPALPAVLQRPKSCGGAVSMDQVAAWDQPGAGKHSFPYLLKVLAAAKPLSIQVHPDAAQAEAGFMAQGGADAASGSYSDASHKPELLVALEPTYALAGFRPLSELGSVLAQIPEISGLLPALEANSAGLRGLLSAYFSLSDDILLAAHQRLLNRLEAESSKRPFAMQDPRFWALEADRELGRSGHADRGLLFVFLLNLVRLCPGEGLFVPAGFPHAYLRGAGIELMASSDNVLRCGLTAKPLDVPEMLRVLDCRGAVPPVLRPVAVAGERIYRTPAGEFELRSVELFENSLYTFEALGPELCLAVGAMGDGSASSRHVLAQVGGPEQELPLHSGDCCLMLNADHGQVKGRAPGTLFRVTMPQQQWPEAKEGAVKMAFRGRQPTELSFGTSGLRGLISDITDLEAYINVRGFLDFCLANGDVALGGTIALAGDLRPSTHSDKRSILRAVTRAILDGGLLPEYFGKIPTPALAYHALQCEIPSIVVTGSHIPFDRNGIKFNRRAGEVLKADESGILTCVARVRAEVYGELESASIFQDDGMFKEGESPALPQESHAAVDAYKSRYQGAFGATALAGLRVLFYEHSAVGRELIVDLLRSLGAEVHPAGRTDQFMAIDTEALAPATLPFLQDMLDTAAARHGRFDAVISTDGDSDRPLVLGVDDAGRLSFVSGDRLGILVADVLQANAVAIPVSSTDAVEAYFEPRSVVVSRTRIGSPYVIEQMKQLHGERVVGWEANGGFLVGSTVALANGNLLPLPTRDAVLPICAVLSQARAAGKSICSLLAALPPRHTSAGLLDNVDQADSRALLSLLRSEDAASTLAQYFDSTRGFGPIEGIDHTDGVRVFFKSGDIAHLRPSGNAPQLRIYAVADSPARAEEIVSLGLAEPKGLLRALLEAGREHQFVQAVCANIELSERLCSEGEGPAVLGTVSGSASAQAFWQGVLDRAMPEFNARLATSFHEDLPVNQAFGLLLLWQRLRPTLGAREGALVAFVFGEGSRATPFTETDNGQKPAILSPVRTGRSAGGGGYVSMVELAMRHFVPVEGFLRRSGFDGIVVKWGDEVQIPIRDLSGHDSRFASADIVRFVSMREMSEDDAANKDWVGVDTSGLVTAFIPRRPLSEMESLAERGLLTRRGDRLMGGVNLGSIAVSRRLLDALLEEFSDEVNDPAADRKQRPDLDPQLFTALTIAVHSDDEERQLLFEQACVESPAMAELRSVMPDIVQRLHGVLSRIEAAKGRPVQVMALDLVDQYWGDIGQHRQMHDFYMALLADGADGRIARALARIPEQRDADGNIFAGNCRISPDATVTNSVLVDATIEGQGQVNASVLIGTHVHTIAAEGAFDVMSMATELQLASRSGTYQVLSELPVRAEAGERLTTLLLADGPELYRVHEDTNLRKRDENYDRPILGNPRSFAEAHALMSSAGAEEVRERRAERRVSLLSKIQ